MTREASSGGRLSWAGLLSGPLAWALSTQINYALAPWQCASRSFPVPWIALGLAVFALAGGVLSWRAARAASEAAPDLPRNAATEHFIASIGSLTAILFALVILLQGFAGLIFDGCER
jgi:hypothetical protein